LGTFRTLAVRLDLVLGNLQALGVEHLGQSGDLTDLHRVYRIDEDAILDAVAAACLARLGA
jgi:pyruvate dehydrogenase complex dehydrogenase (E1) component